MMYNSIPYNMIINYWYNIIYIPLFQTASHIPAILGATTGQRGNKKTLCCRRSSRAPAGSPKKGSEMLEPCLETSTQWIGWWENLQEPWFLPWNIGLSCRLSLKPIQWSTWNRQNQHLYTEVGIFDDFCQNDQKDWSPFLYYGAK